MKLLAVLMLCFGMAGPAVAEDWSKADIAIGSVALTATVIDWGQTRYIAKHPHLYHEKNPILGLHPSVGRVDTYFAGAIIGGAIVAHLLPGQYRRLFLGGVAVLEIGVTAHNRNIGIGISF